MKLIVPRYTSLVPLSLIESFRFAAFALLLLALGPTPIAARGLSYSNGEADSSSSLPIDALPSKPHSLNTARIAVAAAAIRPPALYSCILSSLTL